MSERRLRLTALCLVALSGCLPSLLDNPSRDVSRAVPRSFRQDDADGGVADDGQAADAGIAQQRWDEFFSQPELQALIAEALRNNQELNLQLQEVIIAQAEVGARRGEYLPKVGAGLVTGVEKVGGTTSQGYADALTGAPEHMLDLGFGLTASWEIDLWGRLRDAARSANFRAIATNEGRNFVVTELVAEIARSYFELIAVDNELDVVNRNIAIQQDALEVVKLEKLAARATELAVQRFEAEVLKNQSHLYDLEQERVQAENRINFLVGRFPQHVKRNPGALTAPLPPTIQTGVPTDLLTNRPDVRRAELDLTAAQLDFRVARANFYPKLSIDAAVGFRSFNVTHLVNTPESLLYNLAGNLIAPLLNRAGIEAEYRSANARQIQAVFGYERTLLQAFTDVANQLVRFENLQKSYELQSRQVETLNRSVDVSNTLFLSTRADYMEVLLVRRDSLDAQLELIETRKRQLLSLVSLYQSLGGGWRAPLPQQTASATDAK